MKTSISIALALTLAAAAVTTPATAGSRADDGAPAVRDWNAVTMTTLVIAATPTPEQPLHLAAVHRAVYDAVLAVDEHPRRASVVAAVSAAAHTVLVAEFPAQSLRLDQALTSELAGTAGDPTVPAGLTLGRAAGLAALQERVDDGRNGPTVPVPPPGPGVWVPTPPNTIGISSWLGGVRPFALRDGAQERPAGPPALDSSRWAGDYNETRLLGSASSTLRTPQQTEVARFWADPPLVQNQRALRGYSDRLHLSALRTARLFALADTASADALIACWDAKYHYELWRPFSAIPAGDRDGNPRTPADATWRPLLPTPNFPEYPSAHSCSTTAIATVVAALAPAGRLDLTIDSTTTGTARHYSSVRQLTDEVANARVWGGLHWRFSTQDGTRIGRAVARSVLRTAGDHDDDHHQDHRR